MGCGCGKASEQNAFEVTYPSGVTKTFSTEADARLAVAQKGGTWRPVSK